MSQVAFDLWDAGEGFLLDTTRQVGFDGHPVPVRQHVLQTTNFVQQPLDLSADQFAFVAISFRNRYSRLLIGRASNFRDLELSTGQRQSGSCHSHSF